MVAASFTGWHGHCKSGVSQTDRFALSVPSNSTIRSLFLLLLLLLQDIVQHVLLTIHLVNSSRKIDLCVFGCTDAALQALVKGIKEPFFSNAVKVFFQFILAKKKKHMNTLKVYQA